MQCAVSGGGLSAEESDSPQSDKCVMATAAIWKSLVKGVPWFSLLNVEVNQFIIFNSKCCRNKSSGRWKLALNLCVELPFKHGDSEKWLWEKCFLQFSLKNRQLLPSCHIITCYLGPLTWEVGGLNAAHCTAPNLYLPSAGKVPL